MSQAVTAASFQTLPSLQFQPQQANQQDNQPASPSDKSALGDQISLTKSHDASVPLMRESGTAVLSTQAPALQLSHEDETGSSMLAPTSSPNSTKTILLVTLGVNAALFLTFLASGLLELSPKLAQPPEERFGTLKYPFAQQTALENAAKSIAKKELIGEVGEVRVTGNHGINSESVRREIADWLTPVAAKMKQESHSGGLQVEALIKEAFADIRSAFSMENHPKLTNLHNDDRLIAFFAARHPSKQDAEREVLATPEGREVTEKGEQKKLADAYHEHLRIAGGKVIKGVYR